MYSLMLPSMGIRSGVGHDLTVPKQQYIFRTLIGYKTTTHGQQTLVIAITIQTEINVHSDPTCCIPRML